MQSSQDISSIEEAKEVAKIIERSKKKFLDRYLRINEERCEHLKFLINIALTLLDQTPYITNLLAKNNFTPTINQSSLTRAEVAHHFDVKIPIIFVDLIFLELPGLPSLNIPPRNVAHSKKKKYDFSESCYQLISLLHEILVYEYYLNKNPDLLFILSRHNFSPLAKDALVPVSNTLNDLFLRKMQRRYKSILRGKLHQSIFSNTPQSILTLPANISKCSHITQVIHELTVKRAVVSNIQYHWTTKSNFINMLYSGYIYGNKTLQKKNIFFRKNALENGDIQNGDADVICCARHMVDFLALHNKTEKKLKNDLVRLAIDVNKVVHENGYNQFFKLFDLYSPAFNYTAHIDTRLSITIVRKERGKEITLSVTLNGQIYTAVLFDNTIQSKHAMICYGNLFTFNRFCLLAFFRMLDKPENKSLSDAIITYFMQCTQQQLMKTLTIIAQSITIFAEYNFNSSIQLTNSIIKEVHFVDRNTTYILHNSDQDMATLKSIVINPEKISDSEIRHEQLLQADIDPDIYYLYGNKISISTSTVTMRDQDFKHSCDIDAKYRLPYN